MVREYSPQTPSNLPPLENGDRLTLPEFERRYAAATHIKKIVWQSFENQLDWFRLVEGEYQLLIPDAEGIIRSQVFPGLWLSVTALLNNQMAQVLEVLQAGLKSPKHAAFI